VHLLWLERQPCLVVELLELLLGLLLGLRLGLLLKFNALLYLLGPECLSKEAMTTVGLAQRKRVGLL
jgi:hypothetical protein